jgi:hypothetical protein
LSPPTFTSNRFTSLANEDSEATPSPTSPTKVPKPPLSTYNIPPLMQLLHQTAPQQYVITALANNQVRVQPTTADSYRSITHTLTDKHTEFHTFKLKEERNYRVVLKHMQHSINPDDIKSEINIGHKVANIWNIKQYRTKLPLSMYFVNLKSLLTTIRIYSMLNSFNNVKLSLNLQGINERLPNAIIASAMGTQKTTAIYISIASNAPVTT